MSSPVNKPRCCDRNADVRGMCFTCLGDMRAMTAADILRVRRCSNTPYAIAYWLYNNHHDELKADPTFWERDEHLQLITGGSPALIGDIRTALNYQERDE